MIIADCSFNAQKHLFHFGSAFEQLKVFSWRWTITISVLLFLNNIRELDELQYQWIFVKIILTTRKIFQRPVSEFLRNILIQNFYANLYQIYNKETNSNIIIHNDLLLAFYKYSRFPIAKFTLILCFLMMLMLLVIPVLIYSNIS